MKKKYRQIENITFLTSLKLSIQQVPHCYCKSGKNTFSQTVLSNKYILKVLTLSPIKRSYELLKREVGYVNKSRNC